MKPIKLAGKPVLFSALLLLPGCYKSVDRTDGNVDNDAADAIDIHDEQPDLPPDLPPDRPPDPVEVPPDLPPDFPPDYPFDDVPPITAEDFCLGFSGGVCEYLLGCCTEAEIEELGLLEVSCIYPMEGEIFIDCMADFSDAIRTGRIIVDYGGFSLLLSELNAVAADCPNLGTSPFVKEFPYRLWIGTALLGQLSEDMRCTIDEECMEGLYCDVYSGVCTHTVRLGGVCRDDAECALGQVCNRGRCAEPQAADGPCNDYEDCDLGLWCDGSMCQPALPPGAPCELEMMNCQGLCTLVFPVGTCRDFCNGH